jgi:hypothetical protein
MKFLVLFLSSVVFAVSAAAASVIANAYWLGNGTAGTATQGLPEDIWVGFGNVLLYGIVAETVFAGLFLYPSLKLGWSGVLSYLGVNTATAALYSYVVVGQGSPYYDSSSFEFFPHLVILIVGTLPLMGTVLGILFAVRVSRNPPTSGHDIQRDRA